MYTKNKKYKMKFTEVYRSKLILRAYDGWIKPKDKVLDVGCGDGVVSKIIRDYFKCKIMGTDIINYVSEDIPFVLMKEKDKLNFKNNEFDIIMFNDTLHHTVYYKELLKEAKRIAKKILIFEEEPGAYSKFVDIVTNRTRTWNIEIPMFKYPREFEKLFEEFGFNFQFRKVKKPVFIYPYKHFAFFLEKKK